MKRSMVTQSNDRPEDTQDTGRLLTVPHVADRLQVSTRKVWGLIQSGDLKTVRIDRCTRVAIGDLLKFINGRRG